MDAPGWLKRQRLGVKLGLAFGVMVGLVALSAVVSIRSLSRVTAHYEDALALGSQLATEVEALLVAEMQRFGEAIPEARAALRGYTHAAHRALAAPRHHLRSV
jgi:hypothetical protein